MRKPPLIFRRSGKCQMLPLVSFLKEKKKSNMKTRTNKTQESRRRYNAKHKQISIRTTIKEFKKIKEKAEKVNQTPTGFIRLLAKNKKIPRPLTDKKMIAEINKIGKNFNQITKKINSGFKIDEQFSKEIQSFRKILEEILLKIG